MPTPDIFRNVHKGIRRALFESCLALGRAPSDSADSAAQTRALLKEALRFTRHHGENEDVLLLPMLRDRAPDVAARMAAAHERVDAALAGLEAAADSEPVAPLHLRATAFLSLYLEHMREEEEDLEPAILAALDPDALSSFSRGSVARTAPADQRMMLGWMLPAMPRPEADAFLQRLPPPLAQELAATLPPA